MAGFEAAWPIVKNIRLDGLIVRDGTARGAEQTSAANDGNGNTDNYPFYLSVPNTVHDFSRVIGYDTNYSKFTGLNSTDNSGLTNASNFAYDGHFPYWENPGTGNLTVGNGRPYAKYRSQSDGSGTHAHDDVQDASCLSLLRHRPDNLQKDLEGIVCVFGVFP